MLSCKNDILNLFCSDSAKSFIIFYYSSYADPINPAVCYVDVSVPGFRILGKYGVRVIKPR